MGEDSIAQELLRRVMPKSTGNKTPQTPAPSPPPPASGGGGRKSSLAGGALKALKIPGFKKGGKVKKTGIYKLHKGETVVPAHKSHPTCDI
jgi:hypothetical protein